MPRFAPHPPRRPAIVTGASAGIGAATASALAALGHPVALGARSLEACEEVAAKIRADGGEAVALRIDVSEDESVGLSPTRGQARSGRSRSSSPPPGTSSRRTSTRWRRRTCSVTSMSTSLGAHRLMSRVVPDMVHRRRGDVVFISSDVVAAPRPRMGGYVPAKTGLEAMARTMQMELEGTGVRASIVRPGTTAREGSSVCGSRSPTIGGRTARPTRSRGSAAAGSGTRAAGSGRGNRDFFDLGNAAALFIEMMKAGVLSDGMKKRIETAASGAPHYWRGTAPVPIW